MANSHFIKSRVEPAMREILEVKLCVRLSERAMPLRWDGQGTGSFKFDAVSEDGTVLACLSTARNLKAGQKHKLMRDATFMWLVPGVKRRILAVADNFVAVALGIELTGGRLPPATEIEVVALPEVLLVELDAFYRTAVDEVRRVPKVESN
ncbi:hypothetical protein [Bradyrhizobium sp.]|uniref:hypothetical protein n=1 Tax=Bradyrhizobium sp. TaxID=376 RepID=UPI003C78634F